jgi:hypothetical protein
MWTEIALWKDVDGYAITLTLEPVMDKPYDAVTGIKCLQLARAIFERRCKRNGCFDESVM